MNLHLITTLVLLACSNVFMTLAWYYHLTNKSLHGKSWFVAALISWGIALFEYLIQVPANRIGQDKAGLSLGQLKILQEVITLAVFVPVAIFLLKAKLDRNYVYASFCMVGAVFFVMRSKPI
jgi:uncharacterized protein (DUF486 family)